MQFTIESQIQKAEFLEELQKGEGLDCPCCGRYAQIYKRSIHKGIAISLIKLYHAQKGEDYIHISQFCTVKGGVDIPLARFWGLVTQRANTDDTKRTSGLWSLTNEGKLFVMNELKIKKYAIIYDNELMRFEGDYISIKETLGDKFNYKEIMGMT